MLIDTITSIPNDVISTQLDKVQLPFFAQNWFMLAANLIPLFVVWILLLIVMTRISYAKKLGTRLEEDCGYEYLEHESSRYHIQQEYNKYKTLFSAIMNILLVPIILITFLAIYEGYVLLCTSLNTPTEWTYAIVALSTLISLITVWSIQVSTWKSVTSSIKYNVLISSSRIKKINAMTNGMFITLGLFLSGTYIWFTYKQIGSRFMYYFVATLAIAILTPYLFEKMHRLHNNAIVPYSSKVQEINEYLSRLLNSNDNKLIEKYLMNNIRRLNPDDQTNTLVDNKKYKDYLFAYLMHKNGKETFSASGDHHLVSLGTLKSRLKSIYMSSIRSSNVIEFNADLRAVQERLQSKATITQLSYTELSCLLRFNMFNMLYESAGLKIPTIETLFSYVPFELRNIAIDKATIRNIIKAYSDEDLANRLDQAEKPWTAGQLLTELLLVYSNDKYKAVDVFLCICLNMTNYDLSKTVDLSKLSGKIMDLQSSMSTYETNNLYTVLTLVRNTIDKFTEELPLHTLQRYMAQLRNMSESMKRHTSKLTYTILITTIVMVVIISFYIFHTIYTKSGELFSVIVVVTLLLTLLSSSLYVWIGGGIK